MRWRIEVYPEEKKGFPYGLQEKRSYCEVTPFLFCAESKQVAQREAAVAVPTRMRWRIEVILRKRRDSPMGYKKKGVATK